MGELAVSNVPTDPSRMRISDADRHHVAEVLRRAAGEGRLELDELDERLELTFGAKTYADLLPITADLPGARHAPPNASPVPLTGAVVAGQASSTAIMGDCKRRGVWHLPAHHTAFCLMGSITLDLRQAVLAAPETTIDANAVMGEIKILLPAHMHAVVDGTPIMGDYGQGKDQAPADLRPDSPSIRVKGLALMGSVQVTRLHPLSTPRTSIGTY